jgi:N-acetyl-anhydromuramyl-L-alanine amidase AmpD
MTPFVQAKNYRRAERDPVSLLWIVIHSMESPEKGSTAENVAAWFAGKSAPMASAHYCLDADSTIQCVRLEDVAFAAPGSNAEGVHIELAGYARQTPAEWADAYSAAMLERCAALMAELSIRCSIPLVYVDVAGLQAGLCGVTTHYDVSKAFKKSTHRDPGPGFPMAALLARATELLPDPYEDEPTTP